MILSSMDKMMKNVHQMANLPPLTQIHSVQTSQATGSHVDTSNTNMSSLTDRVDNSLADKMMN
eukprot:scaffold31093_cov80-Attheya_sp.AAC.2